MVQSLGTGFAERAVEIERYLLSDVKVWVEYAFVDNYSNRAVFDYTRQVVGLGFTAILY